MYKGLTSAGLGSVGTLEQFIELAARHRFQAIDTSGGALEQMIQQRGVEETRQLLEQHQIKIGSIGLPVQWRTSESEFRSGLAKLARDAHAASQFGVTACCTYILPSTDWNPAKFMAVATRRLRICADLLGAYGMKLGLEFVGPHHLRTEWKHPFIWDMESTLEWVEAIHVPNAGLLLDCFHWYTNEGTIDELLRLDREQIVHVHINDAPDIPVAEVRDNVRLYPGEGVIDLVGFLSALRQIGYSGAVSQEVLLPAAPAEPLEQLAAKSSAAFDKLFAEAGIV